MKSRHIGKTGLQAVAGLGLAVLLSGLSGCTMGNIALSGPDTSTAASISLSGTVHGGQQPVTGSAIQLYAVGSAGYGSAATALIPGGGKIGSVTVTAAGNGYTTAPSVGFTGGGGSGAAGTAILNLGVTSLMLTGSGAGYTSTPTVSFSGGGGTGAAATATVAGGAVISLTITSAGSGYTTAPTVAFTGGSPTISAMATAGVSGPVVSVTLTNPGSGYTSAPIVTLTGGGGAGALATAMAVPTGGTVTDANGNFNITGDFTCPTASSLVYITASGGNPGLASSTNNTAIKMAAPLGACSSLSNSTTVFINEVTTAAMAFAMGQYFTTTYGSTSTDSFGSPSTTQAQIGIFNAYSTVGNLVSTQTGNALTSTTLTGANSLGSITVLPESTKLYTIADILAACVNSTGPSDPAQACTTLFNSSTPSIAPGTTATAATVATDTLQAAVYLSLNPTSTNASSSATNIAALYGLVGTSPPYTGVSAQPTDWTLGIQYTAGTSATQTLMNSVQDIAADASGNIWIINYNSSATATESLAEFGTNGIPLANPFNSGATAPASMAATSPRNMAIDSGNNVFVTSSSGSGYVFEYSNTGVSSSLLVGGQPYGIAIDGNNNIWIGQNSSSSTSSLTEFTSDTLAATNQVKYPLLTGTTNTLLATYTAVSTTGAIALSPGTSTNLGYQATGMNPGTCTTFPCTTTNDTSLTATYTQVSSSGLNTPFGVTAGTGGSIWVANSAGNTLSLYTTPTSYTTIGSATSLSGPRKIAIDGAGNAWVADRGSAVISEFSPSGAVLSPTPVSPATTPLGFSHTGLGSGSSIAIDPSGNVWIGNNTAPTATTNADSIFELVGAAAPTVTPIALALKNSAVGVRP